MASAGFIEEIADTARASLPPPLGRCGTSTLPGRDLGRHTLAMVLAQRMHTNRQAFQVGRFGALGRWVRSQRTSTAEVGDPDRSAL